MPPYILFRKKIYNNKLFYKDNNPFYYFLVSIIEIIEVIYLYFIDIKHIEELHEITI